MLKRLKTFSDLALSVLFFCKQDVRKKNFRQALKCSVAEQAVLLSMIFGFSHVTFWIRGEAKPLDTPPQNYAKICSL